MSPLYEAQNDQFTTLPVILYRHALQGTGIYAPLHWHRSLEVTVPLSGKVQFNIGSNNLDSGEADWFVANGGELHSCTFARPCDVFVGVSILLSLPFVEKWIGRDLSFYNPQEPAVTDKMKAIARKLYELDETLPENRFRVMGLLFELLELLALRCAREAARNTALESNQLLATGITDYIEEHYRENLSLDDMAKVFKYSSSYFSRMFKSLLGVNFHSYLNYVRVCHAAQELLTGNATTTDCAFRNGFSNVKSFITSFKKVFGQTPRTYTDSRTGRSALYTADDDAFPDVLQADQAEGQDAP